MCVLWMHGSFGHSCSGISVYSHVQLRKLTHQKKTNIWMLYIVMRFDLNRFYDLQLYRKQTYYTTQLPTSSGERCIRPKMCQSHYPTEDSWLLYSELNPQVWIFFHLRQGLEIYYQKRQMREILYISHQGCLKWKHPIIAAFGKAYSKLSWWTYSKSITSVQLAEVCNLAFDGNSSAPYLTPPFEQLCLTLAENFFSCSSLKSFHHIS